MSYSVHLFRASTKVRMSEQGSSPKFFESDKNLDPFTKNQLFALKSRLSTVGFKEQKKGGLAGLFSKQARFTNEAIGADALLTDRGLYFSASSEDGVFEILMLASEWAAKGGYAKYDPQSGGWVD